MPGGQERILRRRINSVQSTKKITRAMELIAATRVVKAMQRADAARPYSRQITSVIENLAAGGAETSHPLLRQAESVVPTVLTEREECGRRAWIDPLCGGVVRPPLE